MNTDSLTENSEKTYIVSQWGQVVEFKDAETKEKAEGAKVVVLAIDENVARHKAVDAFRTGSLNEYMVTSDGIVRRMHPAINGFFGYWKKALLCDNQFKIRVFANDEEEAKRIFDIIPAPKEGDKP